MVVSKIRRWTQNSPAYSARGFCGIFQDVALLICGHFHIVTWWDFFHGNLTTGWHFFHGDFTTAWRILARIYRLRGREKITIVFTTKGDYKYNVVHENSSPIPCDYFADNFEKRNFWSAEIFERQGRDFIYGHGKIKRRKLAYYTSCEFGKKRSLLQSFIFS